MLSRDKGHILFAIVNVSWRGTGLLISFFGALAV
jgi:hypothetical protein